MGARIVMTLIATEKTQHLLYLLAYLVSVFLLLMKTGSHNTHTHTHTWKKNSLRTHICMHANMHTHTHTCIFTPLLRCG